MVAITQFQTTLTPVTTTSVLFEISREQEVGVIVLLTGYGVDGDVN